MNKEIIPANSRPILIALLIIAFLLTLSIIELSSYLRLQEAGVGCQPWPQCYGVIQKTELRTALTPAEPLKRIHRLVATLLLITIGGISYILFRNRGTTKAMRKSCVHIIALLIILSVIGPYTPEKQYPLLALLNITCGFLLLAGIAYLGYQILPNKQKSIHHSPLLKQWVKRCIYLVIAAIALGAWSSANFAPLATTSESSLVKRLLPAFNPLRELAVDSQYRVIADAATALIRNSHLLVSLLLSFILVQLAIVLIWKQPAMRLAGTSLLALVFIESALGWLSLSHSVSLTTVLAHHAIAGLMLLLLIYIHFILNSNIEKPNHDR